MASQRALWTTVKFLAGPHIFEVAPVMSSMILQEALVTGDAGPQCMLAI